MRTPTLHETRVALETALFSAIKEEFEAGGMVILQPSDTIATNDNADIVIIHNVNPGKPIKGEMAGRHGVVPCPGVYIVTLSCLNKPEIISRAWGISSMLEGSFYRVSLQASEENECYVEVEEPYTTNVGPVNGTNRVAISVTIPWRIWKGGYEEKREGE